jgi:hypothetical protein
MFYAVQAEFSDGRMHQWMTPANAQGVRGFDVFEEAATFADEAQAGAAITAMPANAAVRLSVAEIRPDWESRPLG